MTGYNYSFDSELQCSLHRREVKENHRRETVELYLSVDGFEKSIKGYPDEQRDILP